MKEIYNIFSNEKEIEKIETAAKIITDYREKNSLVIAEMIHLGLKVEFQALKVADYIVNDTAIERKTISDFISSVINKRIFRQLEEIKQYPNYFLIIEGFEKQELYGDSSGINSNAVRGMLLSIILKYRVPIIFTKNEGDTASFIYVLSKKQAKKEIALNPKKKSFNMQEQKQFILEAFPGIGPATAKKLLNHYKTIRNVINAPLEDIERLIGKKSNIFKLID